MKVLIVDDEAPARRRLERLLQALDGVEVAGEAANGRAAIEAVQQLEPDVVLMDIRMPGISGIEAAHHLATLERPPAVIFTTAYDEHAIEAFDAQAVGYLLKPVRRERLERTLKRAARPTRAQLSGLAGEDEVAAPRTHICARVRDGLELVPVRDIFYFHADQKYTTVRHGDGEVLIDESLKALEDEFGNDFVRLHRNALAAVRHLQTLERQADGKYYAVFRECDERLAVSRRHAPAVRRRLRAG